MQGVLTKIHSDAAGYWAHAFKKIKQAGDDLRLVKPRIEKLDQALAKASLPLHMEVEEYIGSRNCPEVIVHLKHWERRDGKPVRTRSDVDCKEQLILDNEQIYQIRFVHNENHFTLSEWGHKHDEIIFNDLKDLQENLFLLLDKNMHLDAEQKALLADSFSSQKTVTASPTSLTL